MSFKLNYMMYNGFEAESATSETSFKSNKFYYEPYFSGNIGGKHVRFTYGMGMAFKNIRDINEGIRIWPLHINFGMVFIFGRKYEE